MPRQLPPRPVSFKRGGRTYNATYRQEGGMVFVDSAYGSTVAGVVVGKRDPKIIAERGLEVIIAQQARF
jgi:hypothetical protein